MKSDKTVLNRKFVMKSKICLLMLISFFFGFELHKDDLAGSYVSGFKTNNYDTLKVCSNGNYEKVTYKISDSTLVYLNKGKEDKVNYLNRNY
jgi:hypothetical protein